MQVLAPMWDLLCIFPCNVPVHRQQATAAGHSRHGLTGAQVAVCLFGQKEEEFSCMVPEEASR